MDHNKFRIVWARQEVAAALEFASMGITVVTEPIVLDERPGCTMCEWHALDEKGQELDGGSLSALLGWTKDEYIKPTTIQAVARKAEEA